MKAREAEEKLMLTLEEIVERAARNNSRKQFRERVASSHRTAMEVIAKHQRMIELWTAMDKRMQAKARQLIHPPKSHVGKAR